MQVSLRGMSSNPSDPKAIELLETVRKKRAVLEARLRKEPHHKIADRMGISVYTVRLWLKEMTQTMLPQDEIEELRAQEAAGIDALEQRANDMLDMLLKEGASREAEGLSNLVIVEQLQRVQEHVIVLKKRRAMLLGLDTPVTVKHNITVRTEFDAEVEALVSDLLGGGNVMSAPDQVDVGSDT